MTNLIPNQKETYIHIKLQGDLAYQYSVENNDVNNMQIVLRAYKEDFTLEAAEKQIQIAREF